MKAHLNFAFLIICLVPNTYPQQPETNTNVITTPPDLAGLSYGEVDKVVYKTVMEAVVRGNKQIGPEYIEKLNALLRRADVPDDNKVLGIYLLGRLKPKDSSTVETLIMFIDWKATHMDTSDEVVRWSPYPAVDAIMRVGVPAIKPILSDLPTETNELRRRRLCQILQSLESKDNAIKQIQEQLTQEHDPAKRTNLSASLKQLEDL